MTAIVPQIRESLGDHSETFFDLVISFFEIYF